MEERQTNYTIMEGYELPSKGLIYGTKVDPHVELRSMTARDEMKRLSPSTTPLKTLADIIEGCMIEKPAIHVYDMALGDYEFLLHKLRIVTYGEDYAVTLRCTNPDCGHVFDYTMKLGSLLLKNFDIDEFNELKTFTLPETGKLISLNFQTPRYLDEKDARVKELKRRFKNVTIDFETLVKMTMAIETVDGNALPQKELETFIQNLPAKDMAKILNSMDKLNAYIGIDTTFYASCPNCNEEVKSFFRFGPEFFRPTNI